MVRISLNLLVGLLFLGAGFPTVRAQEELSLQQRIEAIERVDQELAQATQELKSTRGASERKRLTLRIQELQAQQEKLLGELEKIVGPLPASVRTEPPLPLESEIQTRERRHESTLESDVERRLPSK